ncbi:hypothetical protein E2C01_052567 [Portunus trituberculatus]|uniref:Transmembrane protein n=1 Tax=Portunus trituberculatus TaxID=210409 RepID=A0A5B7GLV1_PORTR|nr:hypothetical protein [Portunus trituberculatus]
MRSLLVRSLAALTTCDMQILPRERRRRHLCPHSSVPTIAVVIVVAWVCYWGVRGVCQVKREMIWPRKLTVQEEEEKKKKQWKEVVVVVVMVVEKREEKGKEVVEVVVEKQEEEEKRGCSMEWR